MPYGTNYANLATIFDSGDVIDGDHVKSLYQILGATPQGGQTTVTARLAAIENDVSGKAPATGISPSAVTGTAVVTSDARFDRIFPAKVWVQDTEPASWSNGDFWIHPA